METILILDNYDSFTYNLVDYLEQCGALCTVVMNDDKKVLEINPNNFTGVVLSPGPGRPENAGYLMQFIEKFYNSIPILGVCLGHQALGEFFGLELDKALKPMHGKVSEIEHNGTGVFTGLSIPLAVCRYHSLVLIGESEEITISAKSQEGEIMALEHKTLPIAGVQFHPEAILTKDGVVLIKNWLSQKTPA